MRSVIVPASLALVSSQIANAGMICDFEKGFGGWKVEGAAFGTSPAKGKNAFQEGEDKQSRLGGYLGEHLANSFHGGSRSTGTLVSTEFTIDSSCTSFLVGGGKFPDRNYIELVVNGNAVRRDTGSNHRPKRESGRLSWQSWDVREFLGKQAVIRIVDENTEKMGWIAGVRGLGKAHRPVAFPEA